MGKNFKDYFTSITGNVQEAAEAKTVTEAEVEEAFIAGYTYALKQHDVYDPALFLSGEHLKLHILGGLIAWEARVEKATRTKARIIMSKFGFSDEQKKAFRGMVFPPETLADIE